MENFQNDPAQLAEFLKRLEASNAKQEKYARKQYRMSQITALASLVMMVVVISACFTVIPRLNTLFTNMETVMTDVETVTSSLANSNIDQMIDGIDQLVSTSEYSIRQAVDKLNAVDIDTLNQAIKSLNDVVEPMAKFFGR